MKRKFFVLFFVLLALAVSACGSEKASSADSAQAVQAESRADGSQRQQEAAMRRVKMRVGGQEIIAELYNTPTANTLYERLPMELSFSDYNGTEKIAYPDGKLPTEGEPDGCDPVAGDLCLYAPWGNLSIFYQDFRYSKSLIKLGHLVSGMDVIAAQKGDFTATLEKAEPFR